MEPQQRSCCGSGFGPGAARAGLRERETARARSAAAAAADSAPAESVAVTAQQGQSQPTQSRGAARSGELLAQGAYCTAAGSKTQLGATAQRLWGRSAILCKRGRALGGHGRVREKLRTGRIAAGSMLPTAGARGCEQLRNKNGHTTGAENGPTGAIRAVWARRSGRALRAPWGECCRVHENRSRPTPSPLPHGREGRRPIVMVINPPRGAPAVPSEALRPCPQGGPCGSPGRGNRPNAVTVQVSAA